MLDAFFQAVVEAQLFALALIEKAVTRVCAGKVEFCARVEALVHDTLGAESISERWKGELCLSSPDISSVSGSPRGVRELDETWLHAFRATPDEARLGETFKALVKSVASDPSTLVIEHLRGASQAWVTARREKLQFERDRFVPLLAKHFGGQRGASGVNFLLTSGAIPLRDSASALRFVLRMLVGARAKAEFKACLASTLGFEKAMEVLRHGRESDKSYNPFSGTRGPSAGRLLSHLALSGVASEADESDSSNAPERRVGEPTSTKSCLPTMSTQRPPSSAALKMHPTPISVVSEGSASDESLYAASLSAPGRIESTRLWETALPAVESQAPIGGEGPTPPLPPGEAFVIFTKLRAHRDFVSASTAAGGDAAAIDHPFLRAGLASRTIAYAPQASESREPATIEASLSRHLDSCPTTPTTGSLATLGGAARHIAPLDGSFDGSEVVSDSHEEEDSSSFGDADDEGDASVGAVGGREAVGGDLEEEEEGEGEEVDDDDARSIALQRRQRIAAMAAEEETEGGVEAPELPPPIAAVLLELPPPQPGFLLAPQDEPPVDAVGAPPQPPVRAAAWWRVFYCC